MRGGPRDLRRLGFALADPSLAAGQRSLALADVLRSGIELRDLRLELGFPLIELDGSPRSLAKFVKFGLEARVIPFPVVKRSLRLREVCCKLLLTILRLSSGGLRLRLRGFKASDRLREFFPRDVEIFLECGGSVSLRIEGRFRSGALRSEFKFAAFQGFVGGPQGRLQGLNLLDALRVFSVSDL